tara:strand:+ start:640 stop:756 length:117 start_codon:yes stop_codon:yes gene_type:complete
MEEEESEFEVRSLDYVDLHAPNIDKPQIKVHETMEDQA